MQSAFVMNSRDTLSFAKTRHYFCAKNIKYFKNATQQSRFKNKSISRDSSQILPLFVLEQHTCE